jgi:O-antigen/teichoic acid export membrane protein
MGQQALSGSFYYSAFRWIDRLASMASAVILARLLDPQDFGLVALAMTAISLLQSLTGLGLGAGVIQRLDCDQQDYDVAWTYERVLRNMLLFAVMYFTAPWVAQFYRESGLTAVIRVLAINQLFLGTMNIGAYALMVKELNFRKDFYLNLSGRLAYLITVIPLAFLWRNVWALVVGTLATGAVRLLMSYYLHPFRPRLNFDLRRARKLFAFGGWLVGVQFVKTVHGIIDRAILGRLLGATELGYYQTGTRFGGEVPAEVKTVVSKVMFPVYSLIRHDHQRVANGFRQVLSLVLFLSLPTSTGLMLTADYFVLLVLGPKWQPAIPLIYILVASGCLQAVTGTGYPLYEGIGKPRLELVIHLLQVIVTTILLIPLTMRLGPSGTACAVLLGNCSVLPLWWTFVRRITGLSSRDMISAITPPAASTLIMAIATSVVRMVTGGIVSWPAFVASVLVGVGSYAVCVWFAWHVLRVDSLQRLVDQSRPYWHRLAFFRHGHKY